MLGPLTRALECSCTFSLRALLYGLNFDLVLTLVNNINWLTVPCINIHTHTLKLSTFWDYMSWICVKHPIILQQWSTHASTLCFNYPPQMLWKPQIRLGGYSETQPRSQGQHSLVWTEQKWTVVLHFVEPQQTPMWSIILKAFIGILVLFHFYK